MQSNAGWSLLELIIALGATAIVAAFAVGGFRDARAAVLAADARLRLEESLRLAARASFLDRLHYVVCASADGNVCDDALAWERGWIVFADADRNRQPDAGRAVLKREASLGNEIRVRGTRGRTRIVFQPGGGAAAGSNATFTLCDRRGPSRASLVVLSQRGAVRADKADAARVAACP